MRSASKKLSKQVKVSMDEDLYNSLRDEADRLGILNPVLIRRILANRVPTEVLLTDKDYREFMVELKRIGNNINQIARKINSGESVAGNCYESITERLDLLRNIVAGANGYNKASSQ